LLMTIGFLTNPDDRFIIQNQRRDVALGISDGLVAWVRGTTLPPDPNQYPEITININGQVYGEKGILANGNAFVPLDLSDRLGIDLAKEPSISRLNYRQVVFVRATDLRSFNIVVAWDAQTRTVLLRSILRVCAGSLDRVMTNGNTTSAQLLLFLKNNNEGGLAQFPQIADLYRQEGAIEGVNYDIAFSQMLFETNYLRFGGDVKPSQNNFAGLGDVGGGPEGASFPNAQIGVRAHIQLLKAYASTEPLVQDVVTPRFRFVTRGIAPLIDQLSGRWSADPQYGQKVTAILRRLYDSAQIL
jgi:Mannosyl-glycoprotein endo-beta-N-acetylglucosaminidase